MKQKVWFLLVALAMLAVLSACRKESDPVDEKLQEGTTYMGLNIKIAQPSGLKAQSGPGTMAADDNDYNYTGVYSGVTEINNIDIYLLSADGSTMLQALRLAKNVDYFFNTDADGYDHALVTPFKTTPGDKQMVIILNSPQSLLSTPPALTATYALSGSLPMSSLASIDNNLSVTIGGVTVYADLLVSTGRSSVFTIVEGIDEETVSSTKQNTANIDAIRVPSRVILTSTASSNVLDTSSNVIGTVTDVTYSVAQGANTVYLFSQTNSDNTTKTWGYDYFPVLSTDYNTAATWYDYSDLLTPASVPTKPTNGAHIYLPGKFFLENTHLSGSDQSNSQYRQGNTAYVLVKAKYTPAASVVANGETLADDGTFYVGQLDNKVYASIATAQDNNLGVSNQPVYTYSQGKVMYYVWLNPDNITKPVNSPAIRNNIYHVNITSFKSFGHNWNPLVPPGTTNPDPKPTGPEPGSPMDPTDPLSSTDTYMTADIRIMTWTVHSYDIDL